MIMSKTILNIPVIVVGGAVGLYLLTKDRSEPITQTTPSQPDRQEHITKVFPIAGVDIIVSFANVMNQVDGTAISGVLGTSDWGCEVSSDRRPFFKRRNDEMRVNVLLHDHRSGRELQLLAYHHDPDAVLFDVHDTSWEKATTLSGGKGTKLKMIIEGENFRLTANLMHEFALDEYDANTGRIIQHRYTATSYQFLPK